MNFLSLPLRFEQIFQKLTISFRKCLFPNIHIHHVLLTWTDRDLTRLGRSYFRKGFTCDDVPVEIRVVRQSLIDAHFCPIYCWRKRTLHITCWWATWPVCPYTMSGIHRTGPMVKHRKTYWAIFRLLRSTITIIIRPDFVPMPAFNETSCSLPCRLRATGARTWRPRWPKQPLWSNWNIWNLTIFRIVYPWLPTPVPVVHFSSRQLKFTMKWWNVTGVSNILLL